jgi:DNA repair exonuclease SbcCD nuclease subunit
MSIIFLGDPHIDSKIGNIKVRDLIYPKLDKLIDLINKQNKCVFLGDYFNPSNPDNGSREFLTDILNRINIPVILLIGNHDIDKHGSHTLAPVRKYIEKNNGIVVEDYYEDKDICYISYSLNFQHIRDIIKGTKCKYIAGHFAFDYELRGKQLKEMEYDSNIYDNKIFILGHIHKNQSVRNIYYIGSIAPTNLGEIGYESKLLLLDETNGNMEWKNIKYELNNMVSNNVDDILKNGNENSKVTIEVNSIEEKNKILAQLKDKKLLDLKFNIKNSNINVSALKIDEMVKEYLKIHGREDLYEKVMGYIPEGRK